MSVTPTELDEIEKLERFENLCGKDLSTGDLREVSLDVLVTSTFDGKTTWPSVDNLPSGFTPETLFEGSKDPGLGIRELHEQGIAGKGIVVAIIDQKLDSTHSEYAGSLIGYAEYGTAVNENISMHGPAVASLLVGKDCGTAPDAKLIYKATPSGHHWDIEANALRDLIAYNEGVPAKDKIRIVSCSTGYQRRRTEPHLESWLKVLSEAKAEGIIVVDATGEWIDVNFTRGGSYTNRDDCETYSPGLTDEPTHSEPDLSYLHKLMLDDDIEGIIVELKRTKPESVSEISEDQLRKRIIEDLPYAKKRINPPIIVPSDHRTVASSLVDKGQYVYMGRGGISWSVPYLAGVYAMALQVNPNLTNEDLSILIDETAITTAAGLRVLNPKGIIVGAKEKLSSIA